MPNNPRPRGSRASINDVAAEAGVSPSTVSRVMNGTGRVTPERAVRVREVATRLGYQPFGPARALRRRQTQVWAAIIADIENPFFTAMIRGIEDVARDEGFRLMLCNSDEDPAKEAAYIEIAVAERLSGVVIAVASTTESDLAPLLDRNIPVVAVDRRPLNHRVSSVLVDNRLGGALATEHLLENGCRRVACITGPSRLSTAVERLAGYREALARHGRRFERSLVRRSDFKQDGGYRAAASLLEAGEPPDAMFVANNLMTLGAAQAIRDAGLDIPADVALVGFDDAPWTTLTDPRLTVVSQPTREIGREAAMLLARSDLPVRELVLPPELVVRDSSVRSRVVKRGA